MYTRDTAVGTHGFLDFLPPAFSKHIRARYHRTRRPSPRRRHPAAAAQSWVATHPAALEAPVTRRVSLTDPMAWGAGVDQSTPINAHYLECRRVVKAIVVADHGAACEEQHEPPRGRFRLLRFARRALDGVRHVERGLSDRRTRGTRYRSPPPFCLPSRVRVVCACTPI